MTPTATSHNRLWRWLTCLVVLLHIGLVLATWRDYGVVNDEPLHVNSGAHVLAWYRTFFQDTTFMDHRNAWLYGGLWFTFIQLLARLTPLALFDASHLATGLLGVAGIVAAWGAARRLAGERAGFLAAVCLFLMPRYYGHSFNNVKDVPFAVFYLLGLWALAALVARRDTRFRPAGLVAGLAIGAVVGVRIGGGLLGLYLIGFAVWRAWLDWRQSDPATVPHARPWLRWGLLVVQVGLLSWVIMVLAWPLAQLHPVAGPLTALRSFSRFAEIHPVFYGGRYVANVDLPRSYVVHWLAMSMPELILAGLLLALVAGVLWLRRAAWRHRPPEQLGPPLMVVTGALFPPVYVLLTHPPLYDGVRHLLFVMPPLAVLAAAGWDAALRWLEGRGARVAVWGAFVALGALVAVEMVRLHPDEYVYFNRLSGGIRHAEGRYELDYWGNAQLRGLRWLEHHVETLPGDRRFTVASLHAGLAEMARSPRLEVTGDIFRCDFYIAPVWRQYDRIVPGEIIHTVAAEGVPLLYVIRPDPAFADDPRYARSPWHFIYLARDDERRGDLAAAIADYRRGIELATPETMADVLVTWEAEHLADLYRQQGRLDDAMSWYLVANHRYPRHAMTIAKIGTLLCQQGHVREGIDRLEQAVRLEPDLVLGWLWLGHALNQNGQPREALAAYQRSAAAVPAIASRETGVVAILVNRQIARQAIRVGETAIARRAIRTVYAYAPGDAETRVLELQLDSP